ncbi:MAG TPA: glycosyltransferase [Bacillota bacterium]
MNTPKRVVHITTVHHPYDPRIYHKECHSLQQAGYDVILIARQSDGDVRTNSPIKHIPVPTYSSRLKRMVFGTFAAYKKAKALQADVYHFHDPELLFVGWLLKKKDNIVIYDIHEDYVTSILQKEYMKKPVKKIIAGMYKWLEKLFTRNMELCLAEKYYYDIYKRGICILNYPAINEMFMKHERKRGFLEDKLLYTGNVTYDRGALTHARIPQIDSNVTVHFVGKCDSSVAEEMYAAAGDQKDNLKIEGIDRFVEKEDIEKTYVSHQWLAGIALFPPTEHYMKKELTKFFEYMNAGLPIICSDFPVWKQFVETYECGIAVDPTNDAEIKEAIDYLRTHPDEAHQMGKNGKKAVMETLNWHSEEKKLITWYDQLLNHNR